MAGSSDETRSFRRCEKLSAVSTTKLVATTAPDPAPPVPTLRLSTVMPRSSRAPTPAETNHAARRRCSAKDPHLAPARRMSGAAELPIIGVTHSLAHIYRILAGRKTTRTVLGPQATSPILQLSPTLSRGALFLCRGRLLRTGSCAFGARP